MVATPALQLTLGRASLGDAPCHLGGAVRARRHLARGDGHHHLLDLDNLTPRGDGQVKYDGSGGQQGAFSLSNKRTWVTGSATSWLPMSCRARGSDGGKPSSRTT